jgi:hypothetical protein
VQAIHRGGPADGQTSQADRQTPTRYYAPVAERIKTGWIELARYVYVPPTLARPTRAHYQYTGIEQRRGPVPGSVLEPDWSTE